MTEIKQGQVMLFAWRMVTERRTRRGTGGRGACGTTKTDGGRGGRGVKYTCILYAG